MEQGLRKCGVFGKKWLLEKGSEVLGGEVGRYEPRFGQIQGVGILGGRSLGESRMLEKGIEVV